MRGVGVVALRCLGEAWEPLCLESRWDRRGFFRVSVCDAIGAYVGDSFGWCGLSGEC